MRFLLGRLPPRNAPNGIPRSWRVSRYHHFRSEYAAGLIAAAAGFYTRSAGTLCASSQTSPKSPPDHGRERNESHQLLIDNLAAAGGSRDDNDSLAGLIVTFFSGICLEQNLGPDRARITKKIDAFMRLIRAI
jgi:hypothetical protein